MPESLVSATNQDAVIKYVDGSGRSYIWDLEPGDFNYQEGKNEPVVNLTRGKVSPMVGGAPDMRASDQSPCTGGWTMRLRSVFATDEATAMDVLSWMAGDSGNYVAANYVSTMPFSDEPTGTLQYIVSGTYRGVPDQVLTFPYTALRMAGFQEGNPSTVKIAFTSGCVKPTRE